MQDERRSEKGKRIVRAAFIAVCAVICLTPLIGMLWVQNTATGESDLAEFPAITTEDGGINTDYLSELGEWFEDHFAYRSVLVTANAKLRAGLLCVSATEEVVVGTDGWLYYYGTMGDYCGWNLLSERGIGNIAFNLSLMQGYANAYGAEFIVAIAPDKNSLYDENMPYYYTRSDERNLTALEDALSESGVNFAALYDLFASQEEVLYYHKDTHWNTKGALLVCQALLNGVGRSAAADALGTLEAEVTEDFVGDLTTMLYPASPETEVDFSYDAELSWDYVTGESVEDSVVVTSSSGSGTLLMYRDSFANNMIPFLADTYETAYFTKMVPYDLTAIGTYGADTVIIERAERNLADLGTDGVIMPAPSVALQAGIALSEEDAGDYVTIGTDGDYITVSGELPAEYQTVDAEIYIGLEWEDVSATWYVPCYLTTDMSDYGYEAHFYAETFSGAQQVYLACGNGDDIVCIGSVTAEED